MIHSMQVENDIVMVKTRGAKAPLTNYVISAEQYSKNIDGATVNAYPTYNEDGTVLTDADLTLTGE